MTTTYHASCEEQPRKRRRRLRIHVPAVDTRNEVLLRCVDVLLAAVVLVVPLLMGGRQALGQMALVVLALALGVCWCLRQAVCRQTGWIRSPAEWILLAAVALVGLQLVPLPTALLKMLSPHVYEILPLWSPDAAPSARLGVWTCLSLTPAETRGALVTLGAYAILFLVAVQRIRETEDVERLLRWVAIAGASMAVLGLLEYLLGNGKYFWFYEHPLCGPASVVTGSFTNRNHFAHFVVLAIGPLVWWIECRLKDSAGRTGRHRHSGVARHVGGNVGFLGMVLGVCVFAVLMSLSRGGIAVMFLTAAVCLLILYRGDLLDGRSLLFLLGTGLLVAVSLGIYGYQLVSNRLDDFASVQDLDSRNQRRNLWQADLRAFGDYRWLGTGIGSHVEVVPMYLPDDQISQFLRYTHAENGPLQIALESGLAGFVLLLAGLALIGYWCLAAFHPGIFQRELLCFAAIIPCLLASLLHSFVDFVWYVPGCMVIVVVMAACACRLSQLVRCNDRPPLLSVRPAVWLVAAPTLLVIGVLVVPGLFGAVLAEPCWLRASANWGKLDQGEKSEQQRQLAAITDDLVYAVAWQPDHALAHLKLADAHLRLFEQGQGPGALDARQVREAALASHFASRADLDAWMTKAFGPVREHLDLALRHARQAARWCPLHGATYARLATLTFLHGPQTPDKDHCLQQALTLWPFDGTLLFEAGQEASLAGDSPTAYTLWKRSFQCGSRHQDRLIRHLAPQLPADAFLEIFPMESPALARLEAQYRRLQQSDDLKVVLAAHAQVAGRNATNLADVEAVKAWQEAARAYRELGETDACIASLQQALRWDSSNYDVHYTLGTCLFKAKRYPEAEEHLTWCRQRKRYDTTLRSMLDTIVTERLRVGRQSALSGAN
ncbi:MAG: O-antigen ligase family protein [Thermoguttaceae bacterium]